MIRLAIILGLVGLAGATALFFREGAEAITTTFVTAGLGVVWAAAFHLVAMTLNGRAWQILLPRRRSLAFFTWAVWLREAVNTLLPVARIGGEIAAIQQVIRYGTRSPRAVGSLLVDMTVSLGSQSVFTLVGVVLLLREKEGGRDAILRALIVTLVVAAILGGAFLYVQRRGFFGVLARIGRIFFGNRFAKLAGSATTFDRSLRALYRRRGAIAVCFVLQFVAWLATAGELLIALYFMGQPPNFAHAVIIEAVIQVIGSVAFLVPGALGVQEAGFLAVGALIGLPAELALALALARRARDVIVFGPALIAWQISFGRWLWARFGTAQAVPATLGRYRSK